MALGTTLILAIVAYIVVMIAVMYICVFADPDHSPTALFVTETLPHKAWGLLNKIIGRKALSVVEFFVDRLLLVFYCVVVFGAWSIIFWYVYPWVDQQSYLPHYHKYIGYCIFVACVSSWRIASTTSPGIITAKTVERYDHFPYDNLLFVPGKVCKTRGVPRLARSKFDRFRYKQNVPRFDHFCGWVFNTIGEENYRFFLLFLLVHVIMCGYGVYATSTLFYGEILDKKLLEVTFFDRFTGEELKADKWIIAQFLFTTHLPEAGVLVLMAVMLLALGLFLFYHAWLTSRGMTTNESYKWDQVHSWYKRELKRYDDAVKRGDIIPKDHKQSQPVVSDGDVTCTPVPGSAKGEAGEQKNVEKDDDIQHPGLKPVNIYNRGFVENWKEVIFPISLRKVQSARSAKPKAT